MIERARKRPRDKSVSFRTFGWLCTMEACLAVLLNTYAISEPRRLRAWLVSQTPYKLRRQCMRLMREDPGRGYWP